MLDKETIKVGDVVKVVQGWGGNVLNDDWICKVALVVHDGLDHRGNRTSGIVVWPGELDVPYNCSFPFVWSFNRFELVKDEELATFLRWRNRASSPREGGN